MMASGIAADDVRVSLDGKSIACSQLDKNKYYFVGLRQFADRTDMPETWKWTMPRVSGSKVASRIAELSATPGWAGRADIAVKESNLRYAALYAGRGE